MFILLSHACLKGWHCFLVSSFHPKTHTPHVWINQIFTLLPFLQIELKKNLVLKQYKMTCLWINFKILILLKGLRTKQPLYIPAPISIDFIEKKSRDSPGSAWRYHHKSIFDFPKKGEFHFQKSSKLIPEIINQVQAKSCPFMEKVLLCFCTH